MSIKRLTILTAPSAYALLMGERDLSSALTRTEKCQPGCCDISCIAATSNNTCRHNDMVKTSLCQKFWVMVI